MVTTNPDHQIRARRNASRPTALGMPDCFWHACGDCARRLPSFAYEASEVDLTFASVLSRAPTCERQIQTHNSIFAGVASARPSLRPHRTKHSSDHHIAFIPG